MDEHDRGKWVGFMFIYVSLSCWMPLYVYLMFWVCTRAHGNERLMGEREDDGFMFVGVLM